MYNEDELKPLPDKHKVLLAKIKLSAMGELPSLYQGTGLQTFHKDAPLLPSFDWVLFLGRLLTAYLCIRIYVIVH